MIWRHRRCWQATNRSKSCMFGRRHFLAHTLVKDYCKAKGLWTRNGYHIHDAKHDHCDVGFLRPLRIMPFPIEVEARCCLVSPSSSRVFSTVEICSESEIWGWHFLLHGAKAFLWQWNEHNSLKVLFDAASHQKALGSRSIEDHLGKILKSINIEHQIICCLYMIKDCALHADQLDPQQHRQANLHRCRGSHLPIDIIVDGNCNTAESSSSQTVWVRAHCHVIEECTIDVMYFVVICIEPRRRGCRLDDCNYIVEDDEGRSSRSILCLMKLDTSYYYDERLVSGEYNLRRDP